MNDVSVVSESIRDPLENLERFTELLSDDEDVPDERHLDAYLKQIDISDSRPTDDVSYSELTQLRNSLKRNLKRGNILPEGKMEPTPALMNISLKMHQQRMLHEMLVKESVPYRVSSGINAFCVGDKVGAGKSIEVLSLICHSPCVKRIISNKMVYKGARYRNFYGFDLRPTVTFKTNLIVVPHNIYNQWVEYIQTNTQLTFYGISRTKNLEDLKLSELVEGKYHIVLVKSTRYNNLMTHIYEKYSRQTGCRPYKSLHSTDMVDHINGLRKQILSIFKTDKIDKSFLDDIQRAKASQ